MEHILNIINDKDLEIHIDEQGDVNTDYFKSAFASYFGTI